MRYFVEKLAVLSIVGAITGAALFYFYPGDDSPLRRVAEIAGETDFDRSCSADGTYNAKNARNCFQRGPYRFWRVGLASYVGKVSEGDVPALLFSAGTGDTVIDKGIDWKDVLSAMNAGRGRKEV